MSEIHHGHDSGPWALLIAVLVIILILGVVWLVFLRGDRDVDVDRSPIVVVPEGPPGEPGPPGPPGLPGEPGEPAPSGNMERSPGG